jgi:hypothetical protein
MALIRFEPERERTGDWMYGANRAMSVVPEQERGT